MMKMDKLFKLTSPENKQFKVYRNEDGYWIDKYDEYGSLYERRKYNGIRDAYNSNENESYNFGYLKKINEKKEVKPEPKQKSEEDILMDKIKKIKRVIDDSVYELIEIIISLKNKNLANSLKEKLEYLGIFWYDKIIISKTTDSNQLKKDIILSFYYLDFNSESDLDKFKFIINKIKQLEEWENYIDEL